MLVTPWNGKPISKPGWYSGISLDQYHSRGICDGPAVSSSDLRVCWSKSAAHMFVRWAENPKRLARAPTSQMLLGAVSHHLLLGEDDFNLKYIAQPTVYRDKLTAERKPWNNNAGYCRRWIGDQQAQGRTVVKGEQLDTIVAMARSLSLLGLVQQGLLRGHVECSGFAKDKETGLWLKVRPDVIPTETGDFADLKTAIDVTDVALMSAIRSYGYHQQGALVWEVVEMLGTDHPFEEFFLLFVETVEPFCARTFPLSKDDLVRGRKQNRAMLRRIALCHEARRWPGPGDDDLHPLPLATAERERIDTRLKYEGIP